MGELLRVVLVALIVSITVNSVLLIYKVNEAEREIKAMILHMTENNQ